MNDERLDAQLAKKDRHAITEGLARAYLSDGERRPTSDLFTLLETYAATPDADEYFPLTWRQAKKLRALSRAVLTSIREADQCTFLGKGRGRQVQLTFLPDWAKPPADPAAKAETATRQMTQRLLAKGEVRLLPELLARAGESLHRKLGLPAVQTSLGEVVGVAEFALAYRVGGEMIRQKEFLVEMVDDADGAGKVAQLSLPPNTNGGGADTAVGVKEPADAPATQQGEAGSAAQSGGRGRNAGHPADGREGSNGRGTPQEGSSPATLAEPQQAGVIRVVMLSVSLLRPSGWNANVMTDEEFEALLKEVRRLRRPPKPIVVRATGKHYQIVDGEHSWKAARECGLTEVPCEVIKVDNFEAMRQMLTRNRHGSNDPVKLGRLYVRMMRERNLSQRGLAEEIGRSEGTVRNFVVYAEAAKVRNDYARDHAEGRQVSAVAEIAGLTVQQVRIYMELPANQRDEWFDAGARIQNAAQFKPAS